MPSVSSTHAPRDISLVPETCSNCGVAVVQSLRHCPTCSVDLGCPNVRAATASHEVSQLLARFEIAKTESDKRGCVEQFNAIADAVHSAGHVVVAMPLLVARTFFSDPRNLYAGYETLVGSGIRSPATFRDDSDRFAVAGKLFGSFAPEIRYGVLSLDGMGLRNYGLVFLTLRDVAIEHRVSFLHENSYILFDQLNISARGELPAGYRSCWQNRAELVAIKIEPLLTSDTSPAEFARQLVVQGETRSNDQCVEAHIFGSFNVNSVQSVNFAAPGTSREERTDIAVIKDLMAKLRPPKGTS